MAENVASLLGVALVVTAVVLLAGLAWALLILGVFLLASAYSLHTQAATAPKDADVPETEPEQ